HMHVYRLRQTFNISSPGAALSGRSGVGAFVRERLRVSWASGLQTMKLAGVEHERVDRMVGVEIVDPHHHNIMVAAGKDLVGAAMEPGGGAFEHDGAVVG